MSKKSKEYERDGCRLKMQDETKLEKKTGTGEGGRGSQIVVRVSVKEERMEGKQEGRRSIWP